MERTKFAGVYTDDGAGTIVVRYSWEQRKLSHFLDVSSEKNTDNLYTKDDVLSVSGDFGVINQIEFQGRSFAGASVSNYGVVHTGDVVYTKSPLKANPYGIIKANKGKTGIVSVLYGVYHTRENANADFIQMYFEQDTRLNNYLRPLVNKGAKNTLLISDTDALEGEVCLAPTFDEQKTIGQFFDTLDNLITLHQRKLEKLKLVKKSMLEKMFPKNGSSVPEIRFNGFTDDWEQRKFSELYARSSEKNDGSIGMDKNITVATMQFKNDVKVSTTEYLKTYYTFKLGDIAFEGHQSKEFRYGRFVENDIGNGIVSHIFAVFRPIQEYDLCFWKYAINNETLMQRILARSTKASTMMHDLVTNDFLKETFLVPSVKEQKQIGAFLNKLDHLITLHQRKVEKLQIMKKSMLEKMFV